MNYGSRQPLSLRVRSLWIRSQWRRWLFPVLCAVPYVLSLFWLVQRQQVWIAQVLLAPLLMADAISGLTVWLARCENGSLRPPR
jgi:hypothetical protein